MKKRFNLSTATRATAIMLLLTVSAASFAQVRTVAKSSSINSSTEATKPSFGVRAGVLSSGIRGEASNNLSNLIEMANGQITTNNHTGYYAGAFVSIPVSSLITLEPGLTYAEKGYELNGDLNIKGAGFLGANAKAKLVSQYLDIPVVLKADLGSGFQVFAGPQFSYLMKADLKSTAGLLGINLLNNTMDVSEQFNRWDAAITGGLGYKLSNGISLSASYDYGLSKLDKNQNTKAYNYAFKVGLGIQL